MRCFLLTSTIQQGQTFTYQAKSFSIESSQICNSNWTKWSTIQKVIGRVISKSDERQERADLKIRARLLLETN